LASLKSCESLLALKVLTCTLIAEEHRNPTRATELFAEIEHLAATLGTDLARAHARIAWAITNPTPEHSEIRVQLAREVLLVADEHGDLDLHIAGYLVLLV